METQDKIGAFMVLLGGLICASVNGGLFRSGTIIYERLLDKFGQSKTATAWVFSVSMFIGWNLSFIPSLLTKRYGGRLVVMIGGMLKFVGILMTAFTPSIAYVYISFGVIDALGTAFTMDSTCIVVAQSFEKKRARAMAVVSAGGPLGGMAFAPLVQVLYDTYGYTGMLLVLSAISLNIVVAGALLRPIRKVNTNNDHHQNKLDEETEADSIENTTVNTEISSINPSSPERRIKETTTEDEIGKREQTFSRIRWYLSKLRHTCQFLSDPFFLFFCVFIATSYAGLSLATTFFAGLATEKGLKPMETALLVSVASGVSLIGRLMSGPIFDLKIFQNHRLGLLQAWVLFTGVFMVLLPMTSDFPSFSVVWCLLNFAMAGFTSQFITVLADLVGADRVPEALSVLGPVQGIPSTIGPLIGGYIKDSTGSYTYGFYGGGALTCFGPVLLTIITFTNKYLRRRPPDVATETQPSS